MGEMVFAAQLDTRPAGELGCPHGEPLGHSGKRGRWEAISNLVNTVDPVEPTPSRINQSTDLTGGGQEHS